jgi:type IV pilus assembly protein PilA
MRKQKGFSLIELLIVIAIILIIAAIAVPNLLRSKMAANEASAVGSVRTINNAEALYQNTFPDTGYSSTLTALGSNTSGCSPTVSNACILDSQLASGTKSGYNFKIATGDLTTFSQNADPVTRGSSGQRSFFSDQTFVIRFDPAAAATASSTALQ